MDTGGFLVRAELAIEFSKFLRRKFVAHGLPAVVKPEPFVRVLANMIFSKRSEFLRHFKNIGALVFSAFDEKRRLNFERMSAVGISVHERWENRNALESRHGRGASYVIRRAVEKLDGNAVVTPNVLVHNQADKVAVVEEPVHFANAAVVGDVHTNAGAELVNKFVSAVGFLLFSDADERDTVLRESAAHKLPVVAVACHNNAAAPAGSFDVILQVFKPDDFDVAFHGIFEHGKSQNLDKNVAEIDGAGFGDIPGGTGVDVEAGLNIFDGTFSASGGNEKPGGTG